MERQRSPSYPSLSLPQAIDMVAKLHKANRTSVVSRETAAKDMGYAGLTGRSLTVIGSLAQFGLIERAGKGDIKVSRRTVEILHSVDESDRVEAIQEAAFAPNLFQQLHERFPEGVPSHNALRSYLIQREFGDGAIGPAIAAFTETITFVENTKESGSSGDSAPAPPDSPEPTQEDSMQPTMPQPSGATASVTKAAILGAVLDLNKINMDIRGDRVLVSGLFDLKGLRMLKRKIPGMETLIAPDEEDEDDNILAADEDDI